MLIASKRDFLVHAKAIAAANPTAFRDAEDAYETMCRLYDLVEESRSTLSTSTGGVLVCRDGDGEIQLWVSPNYMERV